MAPQVMADELQTFPTLECIFGNGRSFSVWQDRTVDKALLRQAYDLAALGPTSMNCQPARFLLLESVGARARLLPHLAPPNLEKTRTAPLTLLIASDTRFYAQLPKLFHHRPGVKDLYTADAELARATATRNATLTGGYLLLAMRALGLDCGPMSGFDADAVDAEFFPDGDWRSEFIINVGYGERSSLFPRLPRLAWDEVCRQL
jgi:3-hydroxypropanoate dehydrogenase